ncbi:hypothetical protein EDD22DRAFT_960243 [Suillus occidentalis]|nr:hypothetical protein EDD22DRAFT_960243 [Suillus occidentalis]
MARVSRVALNLVPPSSSFDGAFTASFISKYTHESHAPSHISVFTFACPFIASDAARVADYTLLRMLQLRDWLKVHAKDNEVPGSDVGVAKALQQNHRHHVELPCPDGSSHTLSGDDDSDTTPSPALSNSSDDSEIHLIPQAIDKGHYVVPSAAEEPAPQKPQSQSQPQP